jgi:4a-hydroxytetrahydrobiopterin dehydratase
MAGSGKLDQPVKAERIQSLLHDQRGWEHDPERRAIRRTYQFSSFAAAIRFVGFVAQLAEDADHHPDIDIRYNRVTLTLSTHSAGGVTEKDFALAKQIDLP